MREDTQFAELLAVYPRKDREVAARMAWDRLSPTPELGAFILAHVRVRLRASWHDTPERFIPLLVNFLTERRWEDREASPAASSVATPVDWFEECKRLHNLACGERLHHHHRMLRDAAAPAPAEEMA